MDPLVLPITADTSGAETALDQLGASMGDLQGQLARTGRTGDEAGTRAAGGMRRISDSAQQATASTSRLRETMGQMSRSIAMAAGQNFLENLRSHTAELTRGLTGVEKSAADAGIALLGNLGVIGQVAQGALGVYGAIAAAEREQIENGRVLETLRNAQGRLGPMYDSIASSIDATATAQQRLNATLTAARALRATEVSMINAGTSPERVRQLEAAIAPLIPAIRQMNGGIDSNVQIQDVLNAITSRNTEQLRRWGLSVQFGTTATTDHTAALVAAAESRQRLATTARDAAQAEVTAARAAVTAARQMRGGREAIEATHVAAARLQRANVALARSEAEVAAATGAATTASRDRTAALREQDEIARARAIMEGDAQRKAERNAASQTAATATLLERNDATRAMAEAEYNLSRARVQLGARGELQRLEVDNALREEGIEHLRDQIALAEEDAARGRQRGENATQALSRQAAALSRAAQLTQELATAERTREQAAIDGERRIREAAATTEAARRAEQNRIVDALIEEERERQNKAKEQDVARRESDRQKLVEAQQLADAIKAGPVNSLKQSAESLSQAVSTSVVAALRTGEGVGEALRATVEDQLFALATTSTVKALSETAEGFGALALGSPTAALHFKAAGLHAATAAAAGAAGAGVAALGGGEATPETGGGGGGAAREPTPVSPRGGAGAEGGSTEIVQYYGPVIDGRASTQDQVGQRVNRYQRAGSMRLERQT
jgi:hypothetical protein